MKWYERDDAMKPPEAPKPPAVVARAKALLAEADVAEELRLDPEALAVVQDMSRGKVPRNAQSILKALELRLRYSQPQPKQTIEHQGAVGIAVIDPYALPAPSLAITTQPEAKQLPEVAATSLPVTPRPPVRRRKSAEAGGTPGVDGVGPGTPASIKFPSENAPSQGVK